MSLKTPEIYPEEKYHPYICKFNLNVMTKMIYCSPFLDKSSSLDFALSQKMEHVSYLVYKLLSKIKINKNI